jgi:hypothetical protein
VPAAPAVAAAQSAANRARAARHFVVDRYMCVSSLVDEKSVHLADNGAETAL